MANGTIKKPQAGLVYQPGDSITIAAGRGYFTGVLTAANTVSWMIPLCKPIIAVVDYVNFSGTIAIRSSSGTRTNVSNLSLRSTAWSETGVIFSYTHSANLGAASDLVVVSVFSTRATLTFGITLPT